MASLRASTREDQSLAVLGSLANLRSDRTGRPWVTVAYAQSLDGSISSDPTARLTISCESSTHMTHLLRASHDGILVGTGTIIADDPLLTVRLVDGPDPTPVILDSSLRCPAHARVLNRGNAILVVGPNADPTRVGQLQESGLTIEIVRETAPGRLDLTELLERLYHLGIHSVMVEGGGTVIGSFLGSGLVDAVVITVAPVFVGGYQPALDVLADQPLRLYQPSWHTVGTDSVLVGGVR